MVDVLNSLKGEPEGVSNGDAVADAIVGELGYTQSYKRAFRTVGNVALSIGISSPAAAIAVIASFQISYGGYWGLVWGWIIPSCLLFPSCLATAELASSMPVNGAYYWWSAALAAPKYSRPVGFIAGWATILTLLTGMASITFATAATAAASITLLNVRWNPANAELMGIALAILILWTALSEIGSNRLNTLLIICASFIAGTTLTFLIGLPAARVKSGMSFASASDVFTNYQNFSNWDESVAVAFTFFGAAWSISGWASPAFLVEETHNGHRTVAKSIIISFIAMAWIGAAVCLVIAFCIVDIAAAAADPTGFPVLTLMYDTWGTSGGGSYALLVYLITLIAGAGMISTSTGQIAAFARDGGLPYGTLFSRVSARSNTPRWSTGFLFVGSVLILLFSLTDNANTIIYSLAVISTFLTNALPMTLRCFAGPRFIPGCFSLGRASIPIHAFATVSQVYFIIMQSFPPSRGLEASSFNYNWVFMLLVVLCISVAWFFVRDKYRGLDLEVLKMRQVAHQQQGQSI